MANDSIRSRMLTLCFVIIVPVLSLSAQVVSEAQSLDNLRVRLQALSWRDRMDAFRDVDALSAEKVPEKIDLVFELLTRENDYIQEQFEDRRGVGEGYSDPYYSSLLGSALTLYRRHKSKLRYAILAKSAYNYGSPFALELSADAAENANELTRQGTSHPNPYSRLNAVSLLAQALQDGRFTSSDSNGIRAVIIGRLDDEYVGVRMRAMNLLEKIGGADAHEALLRARDRARLAPGTRSPSELDRLDRAVQSTRP